MYSRVFCHGGCVLYTRTTVCVLVSHTRMGEEEEAIQIRSSYGRSQESRGGVGLGGGRRVEGKSECAPGQITMRVSIQFYLQPE